MRSYPAAEGGSPEGEGTVIKKFAYGTAWKDQLAAMTVEGTTRNFTYDANGNLLSDGKYTYSWTKGSLLAKVTGDSLEATYTYDASGIRTSKTVNGVKTEYLTAGGSILAEKKNGKWQQYLYDGSGQLMAIRYKGADYYYIRDGLMCITGLVDANGGAVVNYRYDSWGMLTVITGSMAETLGKENPYRYKGYYYDDETGMYYLKSRYYQPEICRFISADDEDVLIDTHANLSNKNLYLYCDNNPIIKVDEEGQIAEFLVNAALGAAVNVAASFIIAQAMGQEFGVKDVAAAAVLGALNGGAGAVANGLYAGYTSYQSGANINAAIFNGLMSAGVSLISFGDMAGFDVVKNGNIQLGGTAAKGSIDLIMGIGITGTSSTIDTSVTNTYQRGNAKKQKSSKRSKGNSRGYQYGWKPQVIVNRYVRRGRHVYHELQYIYHGRLYKKWYKVR